MAIMDKVLNYAMANIKTLQEKLEKLQIALDVQRGRRHEIKEGVTMVKTLAQVVAKWTGISCD